MKQYSFPKKVLIIAEIGVNHNGSEKLAYKMIDKAKDCGADIVKFQLFKTDKLIIKKSSKPNYIKKNNQLSDKSQYEILKSLEFSFKTFKRLFNYCKKIKIEFLLSPFDLESIKEIKKLNLKRIKIPSGEINNLPYLKEVAKLKKEIILSTGMSNTKEINDALKVLIKSGINKDKITLLHCNTDYPSKFEDVNLSAMLSMKKMFDIRVGYSDHTLGIEVPIAATALGATIIEKHFTLKKNMNGPDHKASLEPYEFKEMVKCIKNISSSYGNGKKIPTNSEKQNIKLVRKSIFALTLINEGDYFSEKNITIKRPGNGLSPMMWNKLIGKKSKKKYKPDDLINF